ncbi:MAG: SRPBCC domain-containing protein [Actinomycetota bacterium]|nr:SRPBCC domain-containing protein [Actinomycetota bacterium]
MKPLELGFKVDCTPERAFETWAQRTSLWWPHGHSVSAEAGLAVVFEPRAGGRIYERTPGGEEHDWGEVLAWDPPRRLIYLWHLRFDRADATEVEIRFTAAGEQTQVTIVNQGRRAPCAQPQGLGGRDRGLPNDLQLPTSVTPVPAYYTERPSRPHGPLAQA